MIERVDLAAYLLNHHTVVIKKNACCECENVNPYLTNGFFHHYHLEESTFIFNGVRGDF